MPQVYRDWRESGESQQGENVSTYPTFPQLSRAFALKQSEQAIDPTLRDTYENGMESTRARFLRRRRTFTVAIDLITADDKVALDLFVQSTVVFGALPFLLADPRNLENPETRLVRFASMPKLVDAGFIGGDTLGNEAQFRWNVSFQVREV